MKAAPSPERFHALDATRAFALLLGVVFHLAWAYVPAPVGAARVDVTAHPVFDWFFFTSHTFRMQLFFVIAGFFGRLLYHRLGAAGFARARLARIGVPLVVGWLILYPLVIGAWISGGNVSGGKLEPIPLPILYYVLYRFGLMWIPKSLGGLFNMIHLWFLYYLLWLYAVAVVARWLAGRLGPLADPARRGADRMMTACIGSPWGVAALSVLLGLFLWPMRGWFGVDTPVREWVPSVVVLVFYGAFFGFGWLLHRQTTLLEVVARRWRWHVAIGILLSIGVFLAYRTVRERGATGSVTADYPGVAPTHIVDWPRFRARLQSAADPAGASPELVNLWSHLKPGARERILRLTDAATIDERAGVTEALLELQPQPAMFLTNVIPQWHVPPPQEARRAMVENRVVLERLFGSALSGSPETFPWYRKAKFAYSIGYGLVTWLLLFGSIGYFQERCSGHSAAWKYVADSSYWLYLAHLPLVAALQVWMGSWALPAVVKFPMQSGIAFVVLFASYHYLVRSTFIGRVLNGRKHPFTAWPWTPEKRKGRSPEAAP